jgi:hypothetical protein
MDYKKLYEDSKNGKVSPDMTLVMDNDGGYWQYTGTKDISEEEKEKLCEEYEKRYGLPDGYYDIVNILVASGIKAEWC